MAINYAVKYSDKVDEVLEKTAFTNIAFNQDYDFNGVNTINIYSVPTVPMVDYAMTGLSRFGTPAELQDTVQTMVLSKDRAFTLTIDRRNYTDTQMVKSAGSALARQLALVVIPEIDTYNLSVLATAAAVKTVAPITSANAYTAFLKGVTTMLDKRVPLSGSVAFISSNFYTQIRLDPSFLKASEITVDALMKGQVGTVEGIPLIHVPASYLPLNTEFLITNRIAGVSAQKLKSMYIIENPVGIDGWVVQGRVYYDAFALNNKKDAIYLQKSA